MTQGTQNSVVNLGDIAKPADTLINKISEAVGGFFAPYQIKRMAKAGAEAALIKAQSGIQITDLHRRAMHRFIEEEAQRQQNIESITAKALPQLEADAKPESIENDWLTNFFDKSRIVSDEEMQELWAKVLAGEANSPGRYSKRTVNFLGELDKTDAELFQTLCRFRWDIDGFIPLIFDVQADIYNSVGLNFETLAHLDSIGLVKFENISGFVKIEFPDTFKVSYCDYSILLKLKVTPSNGLEVGKVFLTKIGHELASICVSPRVEGFVDYVKEKWKNHIPDENKQKDNPA